MSSADISDAATMIAEEGQTVTIAATGAGTHNISTGKPTGGASYSKTAKAVLLPIGEYRKAQSTIIVEGDEQMLLAGVDTSGATLPAPPVNAVVTLADATKRTLIAVGWLNPDSAGNILYDCVVRGNA